MKLQHKQIPEEFLKSVPAGFRHVRREGRDFLVVEQVFCPDGHCLMADSVRLHGEPSIRLQLVTGTASGLIFVDAYWGSHDKLYGFIPEPGGCGAVSCPECGRSLLVKEEQCSVCDSPHHIQLILPGGRNRILVCARLGCPEHRLLVDGLAPAIVEQVSGINYFGL